MNTAVETTLLTQQKRIMYSANCAQSFQPRLQPVENICEVESSKRLKIRVSLVRFQSRPPNLTAVLLFVLRRFSFALRLSFRCIGKRPIEQKLEQLNAGVYNVET